MSATHNDWRALCYALYLRGQKDPVLAEDEIFFLVAERYPHTATRLEAALAEKEWRRTQPASPEKAEAAGA